MPPLRQPTSLRPPRRRAPLPGFAGLAAAPVLAAVLGSPDPAAAQSAPQSIAPSALQQIAALTAEKATRTPAQRKISSRLLFEIKRQRDDPTLLGLPELRTGIELRAGGRVLLDLQGEVSEALLARIAQLGGTVVNHHPRFEAVRAELPLDRVEALAEWKGLRSLRPAAAYMTRGAVVTEGDVAHRADLLRTAEGVDGTGVKACAVSDSVDDLANRQAAGELPAVDVLPGQAGSGTSEGTALLEIIHDIAPGADLGFATGTTGQAQMAQNILDLEADGCDVIADDIGYFAEGVFQDDVISQAVDEVAGKGVIFLSAAGNAGNLNDGTSGVYEGDYSGVPLPPILDGFGMSAHDFTGGGDKTNTVAEPGFGDGNDAAFLTLQWSDPLGGSANDYDLYLLNPALTNIEGASFNTQDGTQDPFEDIPSAGFNDTGFQLVVVKASGADRHIHLNTHLGQLERSTDGQIFGHPGAAGALAVAAVRVPSGGGVFDGSESVETFSSDGPRRIYFDAGGGPVSLTAPGSDPVTRGAASQPFLEREKPDIAAADGVTTTTPGFSSFFGTSAAAPHAAGIAALLLEASRDLMEARLGQTGLPIISSVPQLRGIFLDTSLDIEDLGFDRDSGAGIVKADDLFGPNEIFADGFESGDTAAWSSSVP